MSQVPIQRRRVMLGLDFLFHDDNDSNGDVTRPAAFGTKSAHQTRVFCQLVGVKRASTFVNSSINRCVLSSKSFNTARLTGSQKLLLWNTTLAGTENTLMAASSNQKILEFALTRLASNHANDLRLPNSTLLARRPSCQPHPNGCPPLLLTCLVTLQIFQLSLLLFPTWLLLKLIPWTLYWTLWKANSVQSSKCLTPCESFIECQEYYDIPLTSI